MQYYDDLISPEWIKYLKDVMPKECQDVIDDSSDDKFVGKNDDLGWFIFKDSKVIWSEKPQQKVIPDDQDMNYETSDDDESCPNCGGQCYHIYPFKQCKDCKGIFDIDTNEQIDP